MGTFPNSPSVNDTTTIGSKTFKWTGYAWTQEVSGSSGSSGGASATGATYVYTSGGSLSNASSNGEFFHSTSSNTISINQNDNDGDSFANALNGTLTTTGRIGVIFGDSTIERNFYYDSVTLFSGSYTFTATGILPNISTGSGKTVTINVYADAPAQAASEYFRFPDGTEAESIVTSFNGLTGDVTGVSSFNGETGAVTFDQLTAKTYAVTVVNASGNKYAIDGVTQDTVHLLRGQKYVFSLAGSVSGHPFHLQTTDNGGAYDSGNLYTTGVVRAGVDDGDITFTVPYDAPNTLYYRCQYHGGMGGEVSIKNLTSNDLQGIQGIQGIQGENGDTGEQGPVGDTGPAGSGGGNTLSAGDGLTLSSNVAGVGHTLGIDPTAVIHVAGISSDGGITAGGMIQGQHLTIAGNGNFGTGSRLVSPNSHSLYFATSSIDLSTYGSGSRGIKVGYSTTSIESAHTLVTKGPGISMDAGGITFADGTFQSSATSAVTGPAGPVGDTGPAGAGSGGSTLSAGDGLTLSSNVAGVGYTLGIDPTSVVHVAGISSDGGITAGLFTINQVVNEMHVPVSARIKNSSSHGLKFSSSGTQIQAAGSGNNSFEVKSGLAIVNSSLLLHVKGLGISMDQGGITFADGTFQSSAASGSGVTGADGTSVGYTAGNTAPVGANTGDFWYENDTGLYYAYIFDGTTLGWMQISGIDGVTGATGSAGSGGGGGATYYGGDGLTLSSGNTFSIDPTAVIHAAGISCDGGITVGGELRAVSDIVFNGGSRIQNDSSSRNSYIYFEDGNDGQIRFRPDNMPAFTIARSEGVIVNSGVRFRSEPIAEFLAGISLDAGITFPDGTFQSTAPTGSTITAGAGMTLAGSTLGIDPTAVIHAAGISSDGGITSSGDVYAGQRVSVSGHEIYRNGSQIQFNINGNGARISFGEWGSGIFNHYLESGNHVKAGTYVEAGTYVHAGTGVSLDAGGITFPDGTFQSTAPTASTVTASYSGHLESAIMKTYYLDPRVPVGRTVTEFYAICGTGGCSAEIGGQNGSISTITVSPTGVTGSLANTTLPVGGTLDMTLTNVVGCFDLRFAVRYTQ